MNNIETSKIDKLINIASLLAALFALIFLYSMLIHPFIEGRGDWIYVQSVWDRWQSLNVGILAFIASVIAFNISRYHTNKQRERDYVAARAFLPDALSSLCIYLKSCSTLLIEAYNLNPNNNLYEPLPCSQLNNQVPHLPSDYKEVFSKCISLAKPEMGDHLAKILHYLQINDARISTLPSELNEHSQTMVLKLKILDHFHDVGEIQAFINIVFDAARGEKPFKTQKLSKADFVTAYLCLDITQELDVLVKHSQSRLDTNTPN